jgi:hypothetical protein
MLAMQYSFTLPADYDMSVIRARIGNNGHLMDGYPLLGFKAFLYAQRDPLRVTSVENLYAPFYLWNNPEGMNQFLASSGFCALTNAFGWPVVKTWSVWRAEQLPSLEGASCATRELLPIAPFSSLAELRQAETARVAADIELHGALAAVVGFDPSSWSLVRLRLWPQYQDDFDRQGVQVYQVGYLAR